ncbi:MAG: EutN/CcmL family microcompartment protein [Planctomycetota bacterium]
MMIAEVVGPLVAPIQHPFYDGKTLLLVQPLDAVTESGSRGAPPPAADTLVAVDRVGAGAGERVLVLKEGSSARSLFEQESAPVRTVIVGIIDEIELHGRTVFFKGER